MSETKVTREQALAFLDALTGWKRGWENCSDTPLYKSPYVIVHLDSVFGSNPLPNPLVAKFALSRPADERELASWEAAVSCLRNFVAYLRAVADALDPDMVTSSKEEEKL